MRLIAACKKFWKTVVYMRSKRVMQIRKLYLCKKRDSLYEKQNGLKGQNRRLKSCWNDKRCVAWRLCSTFFVVNCVRICYTQGKKLKFCGGVQ